MNHVFILFHLSADATDGQNVKLIGVYRPEAAARMAVNRLKGEAGFCDYPDIVDHTIDDGPGFNINEYLLDDDSNWTQGFDQMKPNNCVALVHVAGVRGSRGF